MANPTLTLRLPTAIDWSGVLSDGTTILVLGSTPERLVLRQMTFAGQEPSVGWDMPRRDGRFALWCRQDSGTLHLLSTDGERFAPREFARSATFPDKLTAHTQSCIPDAAIIGACEVIGGFEILHWTGDVLRLSRFAHGGTGLPERELDLQLGDNISSSPHGVAIWDWQGVVNVLMGDLHTTVSADGHVESRHVPEPMTCTAVSANFSVYRVAVADHQGIHLYWPERDCALNEPLRLTYDFAPHCMLFLSNGMLTAASADEVRVFRTKNRKAEPLVRIPTGSTPVGLARGARINELSVLCADSAIRVYALA
jgi:hypothetical protein